MEHVRYFRQSYRKAGYLYTQYGTLSPANIGEPGYLSSGMYFFWWGWAKNPRMKGRLLMANEIWTPEPASRLESGPPEAPVFHTIYGVIKDGKVFMVRFTNVPGNPLVSILNPGGSPIA